MNGLNIQTADNPSWAELKEMIKDNLKQTVENRIQMQETDRRMKETDRKLKELADRFTSQSGHIIEGLMEPSAIRMFQERGYNINRCWKNFKRYNKSDGRKLEVDLLLLDDDIAIIVEVKINCTHEAIIHFIDQMRFFKDVCPEYADKKILLGIAAITYDRDAAAYAHERGLFVIRVSNDYLFELDSTEGDTLLSM